MMAYEDLTIEDFSNYWQGCIAFHVTLDGVKPYLVEQIDVVDDDHYDNQETIDDTTCNLVSSISGPSDYHTTVPTVELFDSPAWIMHRFQLGYVKAEDGGLMRIAGEPNDRRMLKGTALFNLRRVPLLDEDDEETPRGTVERTLYHTTNPGVSHRHTTRAIADVLEVGHPACVRRIITKSMACSRSKDMVREMLLGDCITPRVIVPDFSTAIVGHRSVANLAYVLSNGHVVGTLHYDMLTHDIVLRADARSYDSKEVRTLARDALTKRALTMYADKVEFNV